MQVAIDLQTAPPVLYAMQFPALVEHYLQERERRLDAKTIKNYRLRLNNFLDWWRIEGPRRGWLLDEAALADYALYLQGPLRHLGWHSRNDALKRLRQLLRWAHQRGHVAVDFSEFVPGVRGNAPPRLPVGLEVLRAILDAAGETNEPERNRALVVMLAGTGVRCEECASLRVEDVVLYEDGSGLVRLSVAKNDKLRTVAFDAITGSYLCEWIVMLPYQVGPLFPSRKGRNSGNPIPIDPRGLHHIVCRMAQNAGVRDKIHGPHDLRRMFATTWLRMRPNQGHLLQKQMGHSDFNTTLLYVLDDPTDIREAMSHEPVTPVAVLADKKLAPQQATAEARVFLRR